MSDFLYEMGIASHVRASQADSVSLTGKTRDLHSPPELKVDGFGVIAEVKLAAPSAGVLRDTTDPVAEVLRQASAYAAAGAVAVSVLTEPTRFGGDLSHLAAAAAILDIPVMRKDFLVDPVQVLEARSLGAGGVLLILRMLDDARLDQMVQLAQELDMFVLLEAFCEADLARASRFDNVLVGLNCRDLSSLEVDPNRFEQLAGAFASSVPRVAESGLATAEDVRSVAALGYDLALVGTALMRSTDPAGLVEAMTTAGREGSCTSV